MSVLYSAHRQGQYPGHWNGMEYGTHTQLPGEYSMLQQLVISIVALSVY